jgi:hypothetical protein
MRRERQLPPDVVDYDKTMRLVTEQERAVSVHSPRR